MKFASMRYFILFLLVPLTLALMKLARNRKKAALERFAAADTWKVIAPNADFRGSRRVTLLVSLAVGFMTLAMMRPQWGVDTETVKTTGMDIVFLLDISRSMNVEDVAPNRIKKAKHLIRSIVESLGGDRAALVSFAGVADLTVPLTTDLDYFLNRLDSLDTEDAMIQGTDLGAALSLARTALEQGGETQSGTASRATILISDAEDNEGEASTEIKKYDSASIQFFAIGVGSDTGGPVPIRDNSGTLSAYKRDAQGKPVISKPDFKLLETLAAQAHGKSFRATTSENEAEEIIDALKGMKRGELAARQVQIYHERFQWPLFAGIVCLVLATLFSWTRKPPSVRTLGILFAVLTGSMLASSPNAFADSAISAYQKNRNGLKAFKKGDIEAARKDFDEALINQPNRPEHLYNDGTADLFSQPSAPSAPKNGEAPPEGALPASSDEKPPEAIDRAIEKLEAAADRAAKSDPAMEAKSRFNLGSAYERKGDVENALKNYIDAIEAAKRASDPEVEKRARKNIELLASQPKQQQNQNSNQNDQKKNQNQQSKDSKNTNSDSSKTDEKQKQQQQQQQKRYQDSARHKGEFKSQKLSQEDANRVMSELFNREREVNSRLRKKKEGVKRMMKDW